MRPRSLCASVFLLFAVAVPLRSAFAADQVQLRSQVGEVTVRHLKAEAGPATPGPLQRRDEVQTQNGAAIIDLHSGVTLDLGAETLFAILGGPGSVDGFLGRGTLTVTTASGRAVRLVQISTPLGRVDLRVNEARIDATADRLVVQVVTGSAEINARQQRITIEAGQELELSKAGEVSGPRPFTSPAPPATATAPAVARISTVSGAATPEPVGLHTGPQNTATPVGSRPAKPLPAGTLAGGPTLSPPPPVPVVAPPSPVVASEPPIIAKPQKEPFFGFTTLRLLHEKGLISQGEFDSALRDLHDAVGLRGADSLTMVLGRWKTTLYGFVQADFMWHSTQSFNDFGSNFQVARPGTLAGDHSRMEGSIRDSRIGVRVQAPEVAWFRASAVFELDLLGPTGAIGSTITENSFFVNPNLRVRHAYFKAETPIVDILFGQTWDLFGWQPNYVPTVIQWPGLVGELFSRTTQLRISKTIKTKPVTLEIAVAGLRPPQRDSAVPEFQGGIRLLFNKWTAVHTNYMTSTTTMPASIGISGDWRHYSLPEFAANPQSVNSQSGMGIAVNLYLPIIRATKEHKDNSLSILAEYVTGQGISDLYTGLTGGVTTQTPPLMPSTTPGAAGTSTFNAGVDAGQAVYDIYGNLQLPRWTTFVVGLEYYLPHVGGRVGLFANVSRSQLHDPQLYGSGTRVRDNEMFYNGGLFVDIIEAVRVGVDYARFDDQYADGVHATNDAVQLTGFLFF